MSDTPNIDRMKDLIAHWEKHGRIFPQRSVKDCMAAGAMLLLIKEATPHGYFADKVNKLGFSASQGRQYMACARNFHNRSVTFFEAANSTSKLIELLCLENSKIDALERGEPIYGITLESLRRMSVLQLRKALPTAAIKPNSDSMLKSKVPTANPAPRNTTTLSVDEERMLRDYRKCSKDAQALIGQTAKLLVR